MLDLEKLLRARANRRSRGGKPIDSAHSAILQSIAAIDAILERRVATDLIPLLERAAIISTVSAVEAYFRDMLDGVFRVCRPDFFLPKLRQLHPDKYEIEDLIAVYKHRIHPLELVTSGQSFQDSQKIEKVFSKILGRGFWNEAMSHQVRLADDLGSALDITHLELEALERVFRLRHELVHDPNRESFISEDHKDDLSRVGLLLLGADIVLHDVIMEHIDPDLPVHPYAKPNRD